MAAWEVIRIAIWVVGIPIIVYLIWRIILRVRQINVRIAEIRAEEEEIARNPYAAYARLLEAEDLLERARGKKKEK